MKNKLLLLGFIFTTTVLSAQSTCATATVIGAGIHTVDTIIGTNVVPSPCVPNFNASVTRAEWFKYTPTQNYTLVITSSEVEDTFASDDTRFAVFTGNCDNLVCYSGDDDSGDGYFSHKQFNVIAGTTYYISFDNRWDAGAFQFEVLELPFMPEPTSAVTFTSTTFEPFVGQYRTAVADMNGDYLDDVVIIDDSLVSIHYQSADTVNFVKVDYPVSITFLPNWSMSIADIDKNGFSDILLGNGQGVTFLMANNTGTGFTEISGSEYVFSQRSNFVDINNDGHLDAFVCHDVDPNVYYLNDGTGNLVYHQGGIGDHPEGGYYGSIWTDIDNDGDQDLFVAKCRGGSSTAKFNELLLNNGDGTFTNISEDANMYDPVQTWSSAWNDFNEDGFMDAVIIASAFSDGSHKVMINNGDLTFTDATAGSGLDNFTGAAVENISYDFDNDGHADVLGGGNFIHYGWGDGTFSRVSTNFSYGAIGDLNNDGFLDVLNGNKIFFSSGNDNNWLKVNIKGIASNINGIGARIEVYANGTMQIRDVRSGQGFRYMQTLNAHFGIGTATEIDSVIVRWPGGQTYDIIYSPSINGSVLIIEGSTSLSVLNTEGPKVELFPNPTTDKLNIKHLQMENVQSMRVYDVQGREVLLLDKPVAEIDVATFKDGMYILEIQTKNGKRYADQFIKK